MHITLISVGKLKKGPEKELVDDYVSRLNKSGPNIGLRSLKLVDLASGGGRDPKQRRRKQRGGGHHEMASGEHGSTLYVQTVQPISLLRGKGARQKPVRQAVLARGVGDWLRLDKQRAKQAERQS